MCHWSNLTKKIIFPSNILFVVLFCDRVHHFPVVITFSPSEYNVQSGSIEVDGSDIRRYRLRTLRRSIGIVLQDPILFSGTVLENLRYGNKRATDEQILTAAQAANAEYFIRALPVGFNTQYPIPLTTSS